MPLLVAFDPIPLYFIEPKGRFWAFYCTLCFFAGVEFTMKAIGHCSIIIFLSLLIEDPARAEDATTFLNKALGTKPAVQKERTVTVRKTICRRYRIPSRGNGNTLEHCEPKDVQEVQVFADAAKVTSSEVTLVRDLVFDEGRMVQLPHHPLLYRMTYKNCADGVKLSSTLDLTVAGTKTLTVTKTKTVTTTRGVTTAFKGSFVVKAVNFENTTTFKFERAVALTNTVTETDTQTETRSQSWKIDVEPKQMGQMELLAFQTSIEIPFKATIIVDGPLDGNKSGMSKASDLLNEAERTMPFEGILALSDVSDSTFRTDNLPGNANCSDDERGRFISEGKQIQLPQGNAPDQAHGRSFSTAIHFSEALKSAPNTIVNFVSDAAGTIVPADREPVKNLERISTDVIYSQKLLVPDPRCGFDPMGKAKAARYRFEMLRYLRLDGQTIVDLGESPYQVFEACHQ